MLNIVGLTLVVSFVYTTAILIFHVFTWLWLTRNKKREWIIECAESARSRFFVEKNCILLGILVALSYLVHALYFGKFNPRGFSVLCWISMILVFVFNPIKSTHIKDVSCYKIIKRALVIGGILAWYCTLWVIHMFQDEDTGDQYLSEYNQSRLNPAINPANREAYYKQWFNWRLMRNPLNLYSMGLL